MVRYIIGPQNDFLASKWLKHIKKTVIYGISSLHSNTVRTSASSRRLPTTHSLELALKALDQSNCEECEAVCRASPEPEDCCILRPTLANLADGPKYQLRLKNSHDDATYTTGILGMCRQTYNQRILKILKTKVMIVRYWPCKVGEAPYVPLK